MNYYWVGTCVAVIVAGWIVSRSLDHLADCVWQGLILVAKAQTSEDAAKSQESFQVAHIAATLTGGRTLSYPARSEIIELAWDLCADAKARQKQRSPL